MNLQQAKILLEKINSLYKSIDTDEGNVAPIERDLMLNYLRQLYELFLKADEPAAPRPGIRPQEETDPSPRRRPRPEPLKRTYKPPRIIEIPEAGQEKANPPSPAPEKSSAPEPEKEIVPPEPPKEEPAEPQQVAQTSGDRPEIESLFEQKRATELSEKLGESPVNDLTKAMAINDRLLYMNELFGKSMSNLDETLRQLNRYDHMEDAKPLLKELAGRYQWTEEEKIDTAKSFIKLVRRRYSQ